MNEVLESEVCGYLRSEFQRRIVFLDGGMGTRIQAERLSEHDYRGDLLKDHPKDLKGNNDLLSLTRPDVVKKIHIEYLEAGSELASDDPCLCPCHGIRPTSSDNFYSQSWSSRSWNLPG